MAENATGKIVVYNTARGVGSIDFGSDHPPASFLYSAVVNPSAEKLVAGQAVSFHWNVGPKGPVADEVTLL